MGIVVLQDKVTKNDINVASEEYGDYIKIVIDLSSGEMAIGGEWHADAEKVMMDQRSKKSDLWGGGINMKNKNVDYNSMINLKPGVNDSMEMMDQELRQKFFEIVKLKFGL